MRIELACAVERNYAAHVATMMRSAFDAADAGTTFGIHLAHPPDLPRRARRAIATMVADAGHEIALVEVPDALCEGLPTKGFTGKATWYRILLPDLLAGTDRLIYVDSDALIVGDLSDLWQMQMEGNLIGAVSNVFQHNHAGRPRELGMPDKQRYFNAGVLLMDVEAMRREATSDALREFSVANAERLAWRDQDALNLVLGTRRLHLHPRWNLMNSVLTIPAAVDVFGEAAIDEAKREPRIRHFEGPDQNKPWNRSCELPMRELYMNARAGTPWPDLRSDSTIDRMRARIEGSA